VSATLIFRPAPIAVDANWRKQMRRIATITTSLFAAPAFGRAGYYDVRSTDADLSRYAWESLKVFLQEAVPENDPSIITYTTFHILR
jgi:hypothetical protein